MYHILKCIILFSLLEVTIYGDENVLTYKKDTAIPLSLINEAKTSIQRGVDFLTDKQMIDGSWLKSPAITALVCMSLHQSKTQKRIEIRTRAIEKGRTFILNHVQESGAIASDNRYINYTTSICLAALAIMGDKQDFEVMRNARHFLIDSQITEEHLLKLKRNHKNIPNSKDFIGGIGYGSGGPTKPDLSNTQWALEALYLTEFLDTENYNAKKQDIEKSELAWKRAIKFLKKVQNIPESADSTWIVKNNKDDGGFIYQPGYSKVNDDTENQNTGLRSYGTMTYAGLKSMIYAKLDKNDFRIKAALEWGKNNYTMNENPGLGADGHFYYLHTFSKAHAVYGDEIITTPDGKKHYWKIDLIKQLLKLQNGDGSWHNQKSGRWMESIPSLVTAYALISLEIAL